MSKGPELEAADALALQTERRRPGRVANVNPQLIPLLRGQAAPVPEQDLQSAESDDLRGARGVATSLAICATVWAVMALAARWMF